MKKKVWSNKPSQMLLEALDDLEVVELMENVKIEMGDWCIIEPNVKNPTTNICSVCAAGSVMLNRIGIKGSYQDYSPSSYNQEVEHKLRAIDAIRRGDLSDFYKNLVYVGIKVPNWFNDYDENNNHIFTNVPNYVSDYTHKGREKYKNYIQGMIGILQAEGF